MSMIREYNVDTVEYQKLRLFAEICNREFLEARSKFYVSVESTYFDYGQNWKYTALITEDFMRDSTWQSICPRDYEKILSSDSFSEIEVWAIYYANEIMKGKICIDLK